jgi:sterol desaturase/sphingolipid hydroxylase (fatty acid hydroxylase superfamily)
LELSVLSAVVFALCAALMMSEYGMGVTRLYTDPRQYGLWYLGVSFVAVLILQDTYFYFMHRMFHHPLLLRWLHQGHHRSGDPTPWTSFAFDLPEALIQAIFFVSVIFVVPIHFITLIAVLLTMTVWSVLNHLGFELFPSSFPRHWLGQWFIGSTHHSIHHRKYTVHYGLYFTFWDKMLGTDDPNYENEFDSALRQ